MLKIWIVNMLQLAILLAGIGTILKIDYLALIGFTIASLIAFLIFKSRDFRKYLTTAFLLIFATTTLEAIRSLFRIIDNSKEPYLPYYDDPLVATTFSIIIVLIVGVLCILAIRDANKNQKEIKL